MQGLTAGTGNSRTSWCSSAIAKLNGVRAGQSLQSLEDIAGLGRRNNAIRIGGQQKTVGDQLIRRCGDGIHITLVVAITLLQRRSRVAACNAVGLGFGESEEAARQ